MRAMKALSANYFLKAFLQTFPMAYYTCPGHKNFTFQLPGKCALSYVMLEIKMLPTAITACHVSSIILYDASFKRYGFQGGLGTTSKKNYKIRFNAVNYYL